MKPRLLHTFAPFIRPYWHRLALGVALVLAGTGTSLLQPWPLKFLFDGVLAPGVDTATAGTLIVLVVLAYAAVNAADGVLRGMRRYVLKATGQRVAFELQVALYQRLQHLDLAFHVRQSTGELVNRLTRDVDRVQDLSTETLVEAVSHALKIVGMVGVILWLDWRLSLAMLALLPPLGAATVYYRRRLGRAERAARGEEGELTSLAHEVLSSIRLVKAFGRERYERRRFAGHARVAEFRYISVWRTEAVLGSLVDVVVAGGTAVMIWLGARRVLAGALSPGDLFVLISYLREFYDPIASLSKLSGRISRIAARAERIADILEREPAIRSRPDARPAPRFAGAIAFDRVDFDYGTGDAVLRDISFSIDAGRVLGLVGPTGAGKSTIAALIPRLYDPTAGSVRIDGEDIRSYTVSSIRDQVSWVLQRTQLFRGTVRDNIAYSRPDANDREILAAAHAANAHGFISRLPDGYDTMIGEGGETLSAGQRQKLAIARALLREAPIMILDEPTFGLDYESRRAVLDALARATRGRTTIVIAHDFDLVRHADLILLIEDGRIRERGTHDQLLARGGRYAALAGRRAA